MEIKFDIAKKLAKPAPKAGGISLRSIRSAEDDSFCSMIVMAEDLKAIKESVNAFKQLKEISLAFRPRGRSLEIYSEGEDCIYTVMEFALGLAFNSEDVMDAIDFFAKHIADGPLKAHYIDMGLEDLKLGCSAEQEETEDKDAFYSRIAAIALPYDMGIIK